MSSKGQTINDRLNAAKYTIAGRSLARCICKATTEEMLQPKKKHLDYLAACTYETDISMMQLANQLIERANHSNWIVVYKSLITVHHLMSFGSERFLQYLASSNYTFKPNGFHDKVITKGYNMSTYIRRYAIYINQKSLSYRSLAVDLCRKQTQKEKILKTMVAERLLETMPVVHKQLDTLLNFDCSADDLSNTIIVACFRLLFHDAIRLFASYNDGIINLFGIYFDLNKKMCREAFEAYKKFLDCADRVSEFLKVAEAINLDRGDIPDFKRAPSSLIQALEQHLISLEANKRDKSIVISTISATMPSFSSKVAFEPSLSMVTKDYGSKFSFGDCEQGVEAISALSNIGSEMNQLKNPSLKMVEAVPSSTPTNMKTVEAIKSPGLSDSSNIVAKKSPINQITGTIDPFLPTPSTNSKSIDQFNNNEFFDTTHFQQQSQQKFEMSGENSKNDILDFKPPGFCDGSLLTPEFTIQTRFDPSIDLQTQQQLIQIQREQAASKRRQNLDDVGTKGLYTNNNDVNTMNNYNTISSYKSGSNNNLKSKKESMFEDLEKSMRQSLKADK